MPSAPSYPFLLEPSRDVLSCPNNSIFLLPFPGNCIYADEARKMQHNKGVRNTWVEMLKGIDSCHEPLVRAPQEDFHAVVLPPLVTESKPTNEVNYD
jgi:hypothetical protein